MQNGKYPKQSAGKIMTANVPLIYESSLIKDVRGLLIKRAKSLDSINYVYVLDDNKSLKGILSIKEVFGAKSDALVKDIMVTNIIKVRPYTDQEKVAMLALKNSIKEIPVVDKEGVFLGIIENDSIMKILHSEGIENLLLFGGITPDTPYDNLFKLPILTSLKHRLPWLIVGLLGGLAAAGVISRFEEVLSTNLILAAFIPLIVYMSDAVGTQMQAFIIRDLASNQEFKFKNYLLRQSSIVLSSGIILSLLLYLLSLRLYQDMTISIVLALALFVAIFSSLITGLVVPFFFNKIKLDPANASGPIGTIIQDIVSVSVYFLIAGLILL